MKTIRFIELFAGIGGFRYGLERASKGFKCVWANDNDKYACKIYRRNYGEESIYEEDITKIKTEKIPNFDLLTAGFPCQAFSIAGKRRGFDDTRGTLFFEIARILRNKKPKYLLLENVKGLLSHDSGKTFQTILEILSEIGYDLQWQVLNSKDFEVPQNRERVFIVGHLREEYRPKIFPIGESSGISQEKLQKGKKGLPFASTITKDYHKGVHGCGETYITKIIPSRNQKTVYDPKGISPTFREGHGDGIRILDDYNHRIKSDGIVPTVRPTNAVEAPGNASKIIEGSKIRRLTPTECERLQGFPDGWTKGISDTQRYKCLGNALTTNVVTEIGKKLWISSQGKKEAK